MKIPIPVARRLHLTTLAIFPLSFALATLGPSSVSPLGAQPGSDRLSGATAFSASLPDPGNPEELARFLRWKPDARPFVSAHRGGPAPGFPENCIATFERALNYGPSIVEVDVRRTVDGHMVLLHDYELDRTTTGSGLIEETTFAQARSLRLVDNSGQVTGFIMPTLQETLAWARGRTILELDIKRNIIPAELVAAIREADALGAVMLIVYDMETAKQYHDLEPRFVFAVPAPDEASIQILRDSPVPTDQMIAFVGLESPSAGTYRALHDLGIRAILGTLGDIDREAHRFGLSTYLDYIRAGADVLATDDAARASLALWHLRHSGAP